MTKRRKQVLRASAYESKPVVRGWEWAHTSLWNETTRCRVRMTDTIIFYRDPERGDISSYNWLFTGKNGSISRKRMSKDGSLPVDKVRERFVHLSRQSSEKRLKWVAIVNFLDGSRKLVDTEEFEDILQAVKGMKRESALIKKIEGLQAYIPSGGDEDCHIQVQFQAAKDDGSALPEFRIERKEGYWEADSKSLNAQVSLPLSTSLCKEVETVTATLVNSLSRTADAQVITAYLAFVCDGNQNLWLTHIGYVELRPHGVSNATEPSLQKEKSSLPNLQSFPEVKVDSATIKCRGEFCQTPIKSLSGLMRLLEALRIQDITTIHSNNCDDSGGTAVEDTGQRFKMGNNNLLLARAEIDFLQGSSDSPSSQLDDSTFGLQWQEADNVCRRELGRSNPTQFYKQVHVCANCHRVYSAINKARDIGFHVFLSDQQKAVEGTSSHSKTKRNDNGENSGHDSSDPYDKMFLEELVKQSAAIDEEQLLHTTADSKKGPEHDDTTDLTERPTSGSNSSRENSVLPSLQPALSELKHKKKAGHNIHGFAGTNARSNQQSPVVQSSRVPSDSGLLSEKVSNLESELAQTKQKLAGAEARRNKLEQEILQTRTQCTAMLREKDDQARKQLLELEYKFHSKQSKVKQANSDSSSAEEITRLIETIDSLNLHLDQVNRENEQAKKQIMQTQQTELKKLHEKYQLDMETLRLSEHSAKEKAENLQMQMLTLQSQAQVAATQAKHAKAALDDLTKNKVVALEEKNQRLERQIGALKVQQRNQGQSVNTVASASVAQQDVEAMEKHLNNKIEYLKAQLASEMKCKEELGSHLAQITNTMEQMKVDKRQALAEQEEAFKKQTERIETAFSQEKELLTAQQATLHGKLVTLQANVTDLVQELTMWKSREANAKLAMEKMVEENVRLTRQLVDAEGQVEALQEERKQDTAKVGSINTLNASEETKRVQMEALLRRLDNERQYLKSQLEGQQEMKEKSQKQVSDLQYEIQELKDTMEEALRASELKISTLLTDKKNQEQELRGMIECLEEEKLLLNRQLKEVQAKFAEAREQSLLERDEIDKSRIEVSEMRAQLLAAKEDSVKEQAYAKSASERMSKSLAAVKNSLKAMEEEKNTRIKRLEEENSQYMGKLATTQGEMLVLEEKLEKEKVRAKKEKASVMLASALGEKVALWRLRLQHRAFTQAQLHAYLFRSQTSQEQRRAEELGRLEERLRHDYMAKCDEMTQTLHDERLEAIRRMKEEHDRDREELNEFYQQEKLQLQEDLIAMHAAQTQQLKNKFESISKSIENDAQSSIQSLRGDNNQLQQDNTRLADELTDMKQKCEAMASTFEDELSALRSDWESRQESWSTEQAALQTELQNQRAQFEDHLSMETSRLEQNHARKLASLQTWHDAIISERTAESAAQIAMLSEEQNQRYAEFCAAKIDVLTNRHQVEMEEAKNITQHWQKEIIYLRDAQEKALQDAIAKGEMETNAKLVALQQEMNERKGTAVVQCTSKWQRAMEELQERHGLEKRMSYNEGLKDREKEWQQAAVQIKERQHEELDKVQQEAVAAIRAAEERHAIKFQAQLAELKNELEQQHAQTILALTEEITVRERERAQEHFDASSEVIEQELNVKWAHEIEEQRIRFEGKLVEEKASLVATLVEEKEAALRRLQEVHENHCAEMEKAWAGKLQKLAASTADVHEQQLKALRKELENEHEVLAKQLQMNFSKQLEQQLGDQEARLLREQEDAITQVQEDSEKLIEQVERAMAELKKQKEHLETELNSLRSALEEAEDTQFDMQESLKKQQKQAAFHVLHLVMRAILRITEETRASHASRIEMENKCDQLKIELTEEKNRWGDLMTKIQDTWTSIQNQHGEMAQTLTNYKRDELVAHRSSSAVLSNEISIVTKQLEEVEEMKISLERDIESFETEAQTIESSLRDLMVQSGGNNGSLNMAVVAKKRRLNEEFETLLERIEKKKAEIRTMDQTLASLRARREEKEQEMRAMERKLVEILVQQQKQMLLQVSAVREVILPSMTSS
ncbi:unnamed protein product [Phytophthora fragariaefolia]|uniref:Unnamed protein product n=1 Tax=Phytophthora fragariaefolia TaxID=1490495 RepID=A0A9W7D8Z4_9STRA|nr:unnamed protein product [Phytophthora fragariaefolia]